VNRSSDPTAPELDGPKLDRGELGGGELDGGELGGGVVDRRTPRVVRAGMAGARSVLIAAAEQHGVCLRLVPLRVTDTATGTRQIIDVPCGATRAAVCPPCAERARGLRAQQCREGWHLETEPQPPDPAPTDRQQELIVEQADLRYIRELLDDAGQPVAGVEELLRDNAADVATEGIRGTLPAWTDPTDNDKDDSDPGGADVDGGGDGRRGRRVRSTRRRADVPDLPRLPVANYTVGKTYGGSGGRRFRPSLFVTLTLPGYGRVDEAGAASDPAAYDYRRAVRDAIHFGRLVDRFVQNLRRAVGWNVQYFAVIEAQQRGAPHLHAAIRGTIPRTVLRQVAAATYHHVWWPPCDTPAYRTDRPATWPVWAEETGGYLDPATGALLPTWDQALDRAAEHDTPPAHVAQFGNRLNAQGVLAGGPQAGRLIGYLTKYLTKSLGDSHEPTTDAARAHAARLVETARWEPCSPRCANWLLYRVQPKHVRPGMRPGACKGAAHRPSNLGYGGRRVLVSRWWSGKTLTDHRADRHAFALAVLAEQNADRAASTPPNTDTAGDGTAGGVTATADSRAGVNSASGTDPPVGLGITLVTGAGRYRWEYARAGSADIPPLPERLGRAIAERVRWRRCLTSARANALRRLGVGAAQAADGDPGPRATGNGGG
jgi:hypothetical protein